MEKLTQETERIMTERFGKDTVIALATTEDGIPHVRYVNAFYEDGAFYIITYALSGRGCGFPNRQTARLPAGCCSGMKITPLKNQSRIFSHVTKERRPKGAHRGCRCFHP